jgi:hypothetical protein
MAQARGPFSAGSRCLDYTLSSPAVLAVVVKCASCSWRACERVMSNDSDASPSRAGLVALRCAADRSDDSPRKATRPVPTHSVSGRDRRRAAPAWVVAQMVGPSRQARQELHCRPALSAPLLAPWQRGRVGGVGKGNKPILPKRVRRLAQSPDQPLHIRHLPPSAAARAHTAVVEGGGDAVQGGGALRAVVGDQWGEVRRPKAALEAGANRIAYARGPRRAAGEEGRDPAHHRRPRFHVWTAPAVQAVF